MIILKIHAIEDFNKFKTERGILLEFISCASSGDKLEKAMIEKKARWSVLGDEEINLLNVCMDAKLEAMGNSEKGAENNVCKGIEEYAEKRAQLYKEYGIA